jgi:hypothetical protein
MIADDLEHACNRTIGFFLCHHGFMGRKKLVAKKSSQSPCSTGHMADPEAIRRLVEIGLKAKK